MYIDTEHMVLSVSDTGEIIIKHKASNKITTITTDAAIGLKMKTNGNINFFKSPEDSVKALLIS